MTLGIEDRRQSQREDQHISMLAHAHLPPCARAEMVVGDERKLVVVRIKSGAIDKQLQDHVERLKVRASGVVISFLKKMGEDADEHLVKNVERWKVRASVVVIPSSNEDGRGCRQASGKVERLK